MHFRNVARPTGDFHTADPVYTTVLAALSAEKTGFDGYGQQELKIC